MLNAPIISGKYLQKRAADALEHVFQTAPNGEIENSPNSVYA
jgi:hypothetical protein